MDPVLAKLQLEIASAIEGMTLEQLSWHVSGKWCAAEILEHLYLTYTGTTKGFQRVLDSGKSLATAPKWNKRVGSLIVVGFGYMPKGRESPAVARPRGMPPETVVQEIPGKIAELNDIMARCEEKFGARAKLLDHPVLGPFSVAQWRKFHLVHGRHHTKRIRHLRAESRIHMSADGTQ